MRNLLAKLSGVERRLSDEKGDFEFFGLLLREGAPNKWDLVVSAPWLHRDQRKSFKIIDDELNRHLSIEEKLHLSRIVILDSNGPMLDALLARFDVRHGLEEAGSESVLDMQFEQIFVISAGRSTPAEATNVS